MTTAQTAKVSLVNKIMSEVISLGGFPITRGDAYEWLKRDGHSSKACDYFAFGGERIDAEPVPLTEILEVVDGVN